MQMSRGSVSSNSSNNASDNHKMFYEVQASSTANGSQLIEPVKGQGEGDVHKYLWSKTSNRDIPF